MNTANNFQALFSVSDMLLVVWQQIIPYNPCSQNHRITESQNSRGWKGPLWVI